MTEREHTTHERDDKESDDPSDSDYDEGDTVLIRGWPRHHRNLAKPSKTWVPPRMDLPERIPWNRDPSKYSRMA